MAINKVKYGETTLIDLTGTTATSNTILQGYGAYGKDGVWIDGIAKQNTGMESVTQDQEGFVILDDDEGNQIAVNPLSVTENGTYRAATGNAYNPVTVNVPSPDFIVTLTKNSNDEWQPDCTFAEVLAAYNAGKNIACTAGNYTSAYIAHTTEDGKDIFNLGVYPYFDEPNETIYYNYGVDISWYRWGQEGFEPNDEARYYRTDMDDATPSDVLSGKHFHNANGIQTGTIATKSSSDLTVSGATVTAPAGYYSSAASKSVATGSATTPATTITANPSIFVNSSGLITATTSTSQNITPTVSAGYVSSGTAGTITVLGSETRQLNTKGATTYTPSTTAQTIASGTFLTGTQTISGDSNLVAENIKKDVTIFGITGTAETEPDLIAKTVTPTKETQVVTPDESTETLISGGETFKNISYTSGQRPGAIKNIVQGIQRTTSKKNYRYVFTVNQYSDNTYTTIIDSLDIDQIISGATGQTITTSKFFQSMATYDGGSDGYNLRALGSGTYSDTVYFNIPSDSFKIYEVSTTTHDGLSQVTVNGDADLVPENIKKDVTIFGVTGAYELPAEQHIATVIFAENTQEGRETPVGGVNYNGTWYRSPFSSFTFTSGETVTINSGSGWDSSLTGTIKIDGTIVASDSEGAEYNYTLPEKDINIVLNTTRNRGTAELYTYSAADMTKQVMLNSYPSYYMTPSGFSSMASYAFFGRNISYLIANPTLKVIGAQRFQGAGMLSSVYLNNVSWILTGCFYNDARLNYVSAPHLSSIHSQAFYNCMSLKSIDLPAAKYLRQSAFQSCTRMTYISIPKVSNIANCAFSDCRVLSEINGPSVSTIGFNAFLRCFSLTTASFPIVSSVGSYRFQYCSALTSIYMPNASTIGSSAFHMCSNLSGNISFSLPSRVEAYTFRSCNKIETVDFPNATYVCDHAFIKCSALTFVNMPNASFIGSYCFQSCYNLSSLNMSGVTYIDSCAFYGCSALTYVNLPEVSKMDYEVFYDCHNLSTIILPKLSFMRSSMFQRCYNLLSVYLLSTSVIGGGMNWSIFRSTPISDYTTSTGGVYGSIFVPASLYDSYKTTSGWSAYASRFASLTEAEVSAILNS